MASASPRLAPLEAHELLRGWLRANRRRQVLAVLTQSAVRWRVLIQATLTARSPSENERDGDPAADSENSSSDGGS